MRAAGTATAGVGSAFPARAKGGDFALEIAALPVGSVGASPDGDGEPAQSLFLPVLGAADLLSLVVEPPALPELLSVALVLE